MPSLTESKNFFKLQLIQPSLDKPKLYLVIPLFLFGVLFRIYKINEQSIWLDEAYTWEFAVKYSNFSDMMTGFIQNDFLPPFHTVLMYYWVQLFGDSELSMRFPSALIGVLTLLIVIYIIKNSGNNHATYKYTFFALSPFLIWYSQDARPYVFFLFFSIVSYHYFDLYLRQGEQKHLYIMGVFDVLMIYTHYAGIILIGAKSLYFLFFSEKSSRNNIWPWITVHFAMLLFFLPWIPIFIEDLLHDTTHLTRRFSIMFVPYYVFAFISGFSFGPGVHELHINRSVGYLLSNYFPEMLAITVLCTICVINLFRHRKQLSHLKMPLLITFFSAVVLIGYAAATHFPLNVRYMVFLFFPFSIIFIDTLLATKRLRIFSIVVLITVLLVSNYNYYFAEKYRKVDVKAFHNAFSSEINSDDLIIANITLPVNYYFHSEPEILSVHDFIHQEKAVNDFKKYDKIYLVRNREFVNGDLILKAGKFLGSQMAASTARFPNLEVTIYTVPEK